MKESSNLKKGQQQQRPTDSDQEILDVIDVDDDEDSGKQEESAGKSEGARS